MLRALRLVKLTKLVTAFRIFRRWEVEFAINYAALSLLKCLIGLLVESHWFACVWMLQANFQPNILDTWLGVNHIYCRPDSTGMPSRASA